MEIERERGNVGRREGKEKIKEEKGDEEDGERAS